MTRLMVAVALTFIAATASHAGCLEYGCCSAQKPHFFSAGHCRAKVRSRIHDKLYRMGLIRLPPSGDMHAHAPYEAWEIYYYDRPYQARHSGDGMAMSSETIPAAQAALGPFYQARESELKADPQAANRLEYVE